MAIEARPSSDVDATAMRSDETGQAVIPCRDQDHWRYIDLFVFWPFDEFDADGFLERLGLDASDPSPRWLVQAPDDPRCHTHGRLVHVKGDDDADPGSPAWIVDLDTYRFAVEHVDRPVIQMSRMLQAMAESSSASECFVAVYLDLAFPSERAEWRASLLARPPKLTDLKEDLGRIVLSGLTLRFEESKLGLVEATLEVSPAGDVFSTGLRFSEAVPTAELGSLYQTILRKGEQFASLFVDLE